ncbi:MAG TPA: DUF5671 domain-containing protein [Paludibaculum sp.]|jgi:hypothetical protein
MIPDDFLRAAKAKGASDEFLVAMLKEQGWQVGDVYQALGRYYVEITGLPIPEVRGRLESAREAFFHLLAFSTLATWVFATGNLWFELINGWVPDATDPRYYYRWTWSQVAWQMAALMVAFPAFLWATRAILRDQSANPASSSSPLRRWLTNIALLLTALIFIGDLVTFVATFLQGGLTLRFAAKSLIVVLLASSVFLYYNRGLARSAMAPSRWHRGFAVTALAFIVLTLGLGFMQTGTPAAQRRISEDRRRVEDLYQLAGALNNTPSGSPLPATLEGPLKRIEPFSASPYEYHKLDDSRFELCAVFSAESRPLPPGVQDEWRHPKGRHCFQFKAKAQIQYPMQ